MYKCIYCNSEDLSVSDVISCALTGAKVTRKFVCKYHNKFTNQYENMRLHEDSQLIDCIESSLKFFDQIVINEKQVHG